MWMDSFDDRGGGVPFEHRQKSSVHFEHLIISLITETTVLPKLSYQNDNLIQRAQHGRFNVQTLTY